MLKGITQQWSAKLAAVLLAVAGLVGGGILLASSSTAAVADGQTCSASVKVTSAGGKTYVCAPGASDTTWRWRMVQGPKGATGARGPQGVAGPKGADGSACPSDYASVDLVVDDAAAVRFTTAQVDALLIARNAASKALDAANKVAREAADDVRAAGEALDDARALIDAAETDEQLAAARVQVGLASDVLDAATADKATADKKVSDAEAAKTQTQAALDAANAANARPDKVTIRACVKGASSATTASVAQARAPKHL